MTQTTRIEGMDEFIRDLGKLSAAARSEKALDALEAGGHVIATYAQDNARNKLNQHPTGNLTNSIGVRREGKTILAGVFGVVYAKAQEFGAIITPKKGPYLVFQIDGKWIFTKKVHLKPKPYLRPAVDNHMGEIKDAIIDALRGLLQRAI